MLFCRPVPPHCCSPRCLTNTLWGCPATSQPAHATHLLSIPLCNWWSLVFAAPESSSQPPPELMINWSQLLGSRSFFPHRFAFLLKHTHRPGAALGFLERAAVMLQKQGQLSHHPFSLWAGVVWVPDVHSGELGAQGHQPQSCGRYLKSCWFGAGVTFRAFCVMLSVF